MAQLIVRNIEESVKRSLRRRAKANGRSMEEETRVIIRSAVKETNGSVSQNNGKTDDKLGFGTRFARHFKYLDEAFEIPELDEPVRPAKFRR